MIVGTAIRHLQLFALAVALFVIVTIAVDQRQDDRLNLLQIEVTRLRNEAILRNADYSGMNNFFTRITKKKEERELMECGVLNENGRLTEEGGQTFVDLVFSGMTTEEARKKMVDACHEELETKE